MQRRIYPFLLMVVLLIGILSFQIRQFKRLYEHIKNDKYIFRPLFVLICVFLVLFFFKVTSLSTDIWLDRDLSTTNGNPEERAQSRTPTLLPSRFLSPAVTLCDVSTFFFFFF